MEKFYNIAGIGVTIDILDQWMYKEERTLGKFQSKKSEDGHRFIYEVVDMLNEPEGDLVVAFPNYIVYQNACRRIRYIGVVEHGWNGAYIRAQHEGRKHYIQLKAGSFDKISVKSVLNAMELEHMVVQNEGLILHASYIEWNGKAILFTAPSGTGKSTQADLWVMYRQAGIINGDRAIIRIFDEKIYAEGIPFSGSSTYCENKKLPLSAIVYLGQAPHTQIKKLHGVMAFQKIWEGCTINSWDKVDLKKAAQLVENIVKNIPVYYLSCTPDESAVIALESELDKLAGQK